MNQTLQCNEADVFIYMYLFALFIFLVTGPYINAVKPRVGVTEPYINAVMWSELLSFKVSQVEEAGLKVETADFYFEVSKLEEMEQN